MIVSDDRKVDVEALRAEVLALRAAAIRYAAAVTKDDRAEGEAALDLETAAIRYVRRIDGELQKVTSEYLRDRGRDEN